MKRSYARVKYFVVMVSAWIAALLITLFGAGIASDLLFIYFCLCSVYMLFIRCERCGVLLYRHDKDYHGLPSILYMTPSKRCPVCDIERI